MSQQDKIWIEKCKQNPKKYAIAVDNDSVTAYEVFSGNPDAEEPDDWNGEYYSFSTYGQEFIIELLKAIGVNANWC